MQLIVDSGSTKALWCLVDNGIVMQEITTTGINPYITSSEMISAIVQLEIISVLQAVPNAIFFYGAGCSSFENKKLIEVALREINRNAKIEVEHDLLSVARALCQNEVGIAVILGTGSNSCLYNGNFIVQSTPSLGYILGDEGSGSFIGKQFLADIWYDRVPQNLRDLFLAEFPFELNYYLNKVYKEPNANAFLASFCKWISTHKDNSYVQNLLKNSFTQFIEKQIKPYGVHISNTIHCVGSIAYYFKNEWKDVILENGYKLGKMEQVPMAGLIQYHSTWKE